MSEATDPFGGGESPDYQAGFRDGNGHARAKGLTPELGEYAQDLAFSRLELIEDRPDDERDHAEESILRELLAALAQPIAAKAAEANRAKAQE